MGWTTDTWALGNVNIVQDFQDFLRENGVFIPMDGGAIGDNIQQVLDVEEEHEWTPQEIEIEHQIRATKKFNSRGNSNNGQLQAISQVPQAAVSQPIPQAPQEAPPIPPTAPPIPPAIPTAAPQVVPIAAPPATLIAAPATPQQPQQLQQLYTYTLPEPAVTIIE